MYQAFINGYRLVEVSHGRPYYVYCVELFETDSGTRYFSERRYSEFSALHRTVCFSVLSFFFFRIPMFSFCLCGYDVRREIKLKYIFNNFLN